MLSMVRALCPTFPAAGPFAFQRPEKRRSFEETFSDTTDVRLDNQVMGISPL
jgi:hypothetical protein